MQHKPVVNSRWPVRMVSPLLVMLNDVWSKFAWHPASHSWPIYIKEIWVRPVSIWAWRPNAGACGKFSAHATLVDLSCCPFGRTTIIGVVIPAMILRGSDGRIYCAVAPVLAMAVVGCRVGFWLITLARFI